MAKSNRKNKPQNASSEEASTNKKPRRRKKKKLDFKRYLMIAAIGLALVAFIFSGLPTNMGGTKKVRNTGEENKSTPTTTTKVPTFKEEGSLQFVNPEGAPIRKIKLEVADDEPQRVQGMMYRKTIPQDTGMLFIFDDVAPRSFWMKNTYVSLDIIFVDADFNILNIHHNTTPLSEQLYPSKAPAKYVLEVAGGYTAAYGIKQGDRIDFTRN